MLNITLPRNLHHFDQVTVVTNLADKVSAKAARHCNVGIAYTHCSAPNRWRAVETGLDAVGRDGLLCIMDANVLLPTVLPAEPFLQDFLYLPVCRLWTNVAQPVPREGWWWSLPIYQQGNFIQIFHANDNHLPNPPWYTSQNGEFLRRWPEAHQLRPRFDVVHLGVPTPLGT